MAKRSPILGYNHNVRYRGLVFHVQTEDSGILSPHLFTHLFHHGVIVSTRKLVYDSGSAEDSIKALMQAQHKAVLKDLKRGQFDAKIDEYLGGTPGLLPRGRGDAAVSEASEPRLARPSSPVQVPAPPILPEGHIIPEPALSTRPTEAEVSLVHEPSMEDPSIGLRPTEHAVDAPQRTITAERKSPAAVARPATYREDGAVEAAVASANAATTRTEALEDFDSSPEILIQLELDDSDEIELPRSRSSRDTDVAAPRDGDDHTRPTMDVSQLDATSGPTRMPGESIPPLPAPPERRPSTAVGAASLPPARPIARPPNRPAITPPQVIARPLPPDERSRRESEAVEIYAPAPPSADTPPGIADRMTGVPTPGQYSQHKKVSTRIPTDILRGDRGGSVPPGLARPGRTGQPTNTPAAGVPKPLPRDSFGPPPPIPVPRQSSDPGAKNRTPTPTRPATSPASPSPSRTGSSTNINTGGGVVMTRPAVIVGAPAKPTAATTQRVRKAREDEGRGFGQGLISEKSLDEVILAYLSEDAEEK